MASYHEQLLAAGRKLLSRQHGPASEPDEACIRRSISTFYYGLYHFLIDQACRQIIGPEDQLRMRRQILARSFTHIGVKAGLDRVEGASPDKLSLPFFRSGEDIDPLQTPDFARTMAKTFANAQAKRHDADYNMNQTLSAEDAEELADRSTKAIGAWEAAGSPAERDFKAALGILMLLGGKLRSGP